MKNVAALLAASFLMLLVACAPDRPVTSQAAEASSSTAETGVGRVFPSHTTAADGEIRDAKEAAEDAARKIFDVTRSAAWRIRDVGVGAVQAVQSGGAAENEETPPKEVADANPAAAAESVPARN